LPPAFREKTEKDGIEREKKPAFARKAGYIAFSIGSAYFFG
jgi:hypothetical protein